VTIELRRAREHELKKFDVLDRQAHASRFVIQTGLATHLQNFRHPDITYLSIERAGDFCGYFILVREAQTDSVEFRRILIDRNRRGAGQAAIVAMENYCRENWNPKRIWLDVFEDNEIGRHIYQKLGYLRFREEMFDGRKLLFFEKQLRPG
jgi:diamine N-acetyltransferase